MHRGLGWRGRRPERRRWIITHLIHYGEGVKRFLVFLGGGGVGRGCKWFVFFGGVWGNRQKGLVIVFFEGAGKLRFLIVGTVNCCGLSLFGEVVYLVAEIGVYLHAGFRGGSSSSRIPKGLLCRVFDN